MPKLQYVVDENDLRSQQALDEVAKDAPKPEVVQDMQQTLARVLQSQTPPQAENNTIGSTAQGAQSGWGKA